MALFSHVLECYLLPLQQVCVFQPLLRARALALALSLSLSLSMCVCVCPPLTLCHVCSCARA